MGHLSIQLEWRRREQAFRAGAYSTVHTVHYNDNFALHVDAAPDWGGHPDNTNPEQALAAALSSCHMMTFLALSAKAKWPVASYEDEADAHLGKNPKGQMSVSQIDLHPRVQFDAGFAVDEQQLAEMHERAHRYCFIANSLADTVAINIL
ncbi:MAG: OsmC family protein [Granulosicoccaceae bacterium]